MKEEDEDEKCVFIKNTYSKNSSTGEDLLVVLLILVRFVITDVLVEPA